MADKKLISIITPVFNEADNLATYYERVSQCLAQLPQYDFEIIFTDNASIDDTFDILKDLAAKDSRIRAYRLSKNFGYQRSIFTGYTKTRGDAVIELDCDLQDPPELLSTFLNIWEKGVKIVYGIRKKRKESPLLTWSRKVFYRLLNVLSDDDIPIDAGDFMLLDRQVVDQLVNVYDYHIYIRGTVFGFGFNRQGVVYEREARVQGESKFDLVRLVSLALDGIVGHSIVPLRISLFMGILIALVMLVLSTGYIVLRLTDNTIPPGFTTTMLLILFSISLNGLFLGIIGEYLARTYQQTRRRPLSIIEEEILSE